MKIFMLKIFPWKAFLKLIKELSRNNAAASIDNPVSVLKESVSGYYEKLTDTCNNFVRNSTFPKILKKA